MPGVVTNPRFIAETAIGFDWQASEGESVPGTPYTPAQFIVAQVLTRNPDPKYIHPNGTHGSIFKRKDGDRIVAQAFKAEVKFWGSRFQIMPFLESVMGGQPTVAFGDMVITGGSSISALSLVGARPYHNLSPYVSTPPSAPQLYLSLVPAGGPAFPVAVTVYKDAARTIEVASCSVAAAATPTPLVAFGNSGLTGSITLSGPVSQTPGVAISKITFAFAIQHARYFRIYYTDGTDSYALSDCVVDNLKFTSAENGALECTAMIMAKRRTITNAVTFLPNQTQLDLVCYSHSELTLTRDPAGSPVTPVVDSFDFTIKNNVLQYVGNSATPQKLIKRGWVDLTGTLKGETSDELTGLIQQARANTVPGGGFFRMQILYTLASKDFLIDLQQVKPSLKEPGIATELVDKTDLEWDAYYDGAVTPAAITIGV
jgi:hypothetical protein